jgi:hypothetical protein
MPITWPGAQLPDAEQSVLAVHKALEALEQADPWLAQAAQMRYFGRARLALAAALR